MWVEAKSGKDRSARIAGNLKCLDLIEGTSGEDADRRTIPVSTPSPAEPGMFPGYPFLANVICESLMARLPPAFAAPRFAVGAPSVAAEKRCKGRRQPWPWVYVGPLYHNAARLLTRRKRRAALP